MDQRTTTQVFLLLFAVFASADNHPRPFTLEETYAWHREPSTPRWLTDVEIEFKDIATKNVLSLNVVSNRTRTLLPASVLRKYRASEYRFSHDGKYALLRYRNDSKVDGSQPWLTRYKFVVYSLSTRAYLPVDEDSYLQHAEWVPNHHAVLYVKGNNIYRFGLDRSHRAVTRGGRPGAVFHGVCDWMYKGEIFKDDPALTFSPDGTQLLYVKFDSRGVSLLTIRYQAAAGHLSPEERKYRFATPGSYLPWYEVWHFNFTAMSSQRISTYAEGKELLQSIAWVSNDIVQLVRLNRVQNESVTELCWVREPWRGSCQAVVEDRNPKGWANALPVLVSRDGERYLRRVRKAGTSGAEFYHLEVVQRSGEAADVSPGNFMVSGVVGWDEERQLVYFQASYGDQPSFDHVYMSSETGAFPPYCLTCALPSSDGLPCQAASVSFNSKFTHLVGTCLGPGPNITAAYHNVVPLDGPIRVLDDSADVRLWLHHRLQPQVMNLQVKVTDTMDAEVRLYLPPDIDASGKRKYPLLIAGCGGPNTDQVRNQFRVDWSLYLTTNRSVVYGVIDGRGSGRKGTEMMYAAYRALGTVEIQDQVTVTRYLRDSLPFIDPDRIGIWGWNVGGYVTTKVLEDDAEGVFRCGVAVAPVADWTYYNAIYTERYLDLPERNPYGYGRSSTLYNAANLEDKEYLLVYGTGEDKLNYRHSAELARALQESGVGFDVQEYADLTNSTGDDRYRVYLKMDRFLARCFRPTR